MRTNIDIDSELMEKAMKAAEIKTKKATVDEALRMFVRTKAQGGLRELFGAVQWEGDLEQSRLNRLPDDAWTR
jgi:Arc/MetJ family transcription regulator